jgi:ribose transport system ATP-binding protein
VVSPPLLEARGLTKRFPGVVALHDVSLRLGAGEVLAVIGENGAGKSTLMRILAGVERPDGGEVLLDGRAARIGSVQEAQGLGISLIHQELNLAENLDAGANIFLGREPHRLGLLDRRRIDRQAAGLLARVGLTVSPRTPVDRLAPGQRQLVEIAKALSVSARILIMDEPTSSLTQSEAARLFRVVGDLRGRGIAIIYISHRLGEVVSLADRVMVLRDGKNAGELRGGEIDRDRMVRMMVGRELSQLYHRRPRTPGEPVLEVTGLRTAAWPREEVSLSVRAGEMVALGGLVGAGRTDLLRAIFGAEPPLAGRIVVRGTPARCSSPRQAIRAGVALVPEDRKLDGLIAEMTVRENLSLASLHRDRRAAGLLDRAAERRLAARMIGELAIRTAGDRRPAGLLSGGNQQKVVLGRWLALDPRVLLLDEPTRGIDVGAKEEIYLLMERLAERGVGILFASSEMEEVFGMADRVLVMREGRIAGELDRDGLSEEAVMGLATGGGRAAPAGGASGS